MSALEKLINELENAHGWQQARIDRLQQMIRELGIDVDKPNEEEPDRPNHKYELPELVKTNIPLNIVGKRPMPGPTSLTIHYAANRMFDNDLVREAESVLRWAAHDGKRLHYIVLGRDGRFYLPKNFSWDTYGWHTGRTNEAKYGSKHSLGIEGSNPGILQPYGDVLYPWYNWNRQTKRPRYENKDFFTKEQCRYAKAEENIIEGWYLPFNDLQINGLYNFSLLVKQKFDFFDLDDIRGHDEICDPVGRKQDPGGTLPYPVSEFRSKVKEYAKEV